MLLHRSSPLAADEVAFVICVEANQLEPQALMLCESIRTFGGRYRNSSIVAVSPRPLLALAASSRSRLETLGVTYVLLPLNETGSQYGTINRIVVGAWAEVELPQPYLVILDTDTIIVDEPSFVRADAGVRPVDVKGSASSGPGDPLDEYWARMCEFGGADLSDLPMLNTTIDNVEIRASYNGGFTVVRRDLGILQRTKAIFFESLIAELRPLQGLALNIKASTGLVGEKVSEWWGSSQAALSVAIWSTTSNVHVYDARYNIPAHSVVKAPHGWPMSPNTGPVLIHYHYLALPEYQDHLQQVLRMLRCPPRVLDWIELPLARFNSSSEQNETGHSSCLCTLAIHEPYRRRARELCSDAPHVPWVVITDEPAEFTDLGIRAVAHVATGPMAVDYLDWIAPTGDNRGAAAYHDKRFALIAALEEHDTAIFLDADSRITELPRLGPFPPGLCVLPVVQRSINEHLAATGTWRLPAFVALAEHLTGDADVLDSARWCHESCIAVTKDGRESSFFDTWGRAAEFLQARNLFSGEGGVIGLAAAIVGWNVNFSALVSFGASVTHEGGGPKRSGE